MVVIWAGNPVHDLLTSFVDSWLSMRSLQEPFSTDLALVSTVPQVLDADIKKRDSVVAAFKRAWSAYEKDAMGYDEYHPLSHKGSNLSPAGGIGYFIIDSIDTMLLMGLSEEYARARRWVAHELSFDRDGEFNSFETTIRVLGGLLSAYHLSEDPLFLEKATDLADRMLPIFDTPSGLPWPGINLSKRKGVPDKYSAFVGSTAEVATLQLEFRYLSQLSGNDIYWRKAENVMRVLKEGQLPRGLAPIFMNLTTGEYILSTIRLGSRGDSYYEYLLKQYIQTNVSERVYADMYNEAMDGIHVSLIQRTAMSKLLHTSELVPSKTAAGEISWRLLAKQDHLVCFFAGSLMLGATRTGALVHQVSVPPAVGELSEMGTRDWKTGIELLQTCVHTHDTATGLPPEIVHFRSLDDEMQDVRPMRSDWYIKGSGAGTSPYDARYMLRPETIESLFIAYRLTGNKVYRDRGWKIFQAIEKHCHVENGGYATVIDVSEAPARHEDKMETFLMSETLKYLFLLFSDSNLVPLDKYVFNTEAHPLPIFNPTFKTGFA